MTLITPSCVATSRNLAFLSLIIALLQTPFARAELVVVMHADAGIKQLSASEVSHIFLDKRMLLPNGQRAIPVDQPKGALRDMFYEKFTGKKRAMISAYWAQRLFTGSGTPPAQMESPEAVVEYVVKTPNAIGYIDSAQITPALRVVAKQP